MNTRKVLAGLALAAAVFNRPKAWVISRGMVSTPVPMGKFSWLRWVWAPQYLSAGTRTSTMESCAMRYSIICLSAPFRGNGIQIRATPERRAASATALATAGPTRGSRAAGMM